MSKPLTDEMLRILRAVEAGEMTVNSVGRYVIEGQERPDRRSREILAKRGLIAHDYKQGQGAFWRITAKGRARMHEWRACA